MKKILIVALSIVLWSCNNDDNSSPKSTPTPEVDLKYSYTYDGEPFEILKEYETGVADEKVKIARLKMLLTKFTLIDSDGKKVTFQDKVDYHLLNADKSAAENVKKLTNVPVGTYEYVQFNFGLNYEEDLTDGDNDGAALVDIINFKGEDTDMDWDWSLGYKFLNLEGVYTTGDEEEQNFLFHIGTHQSGSVGHHSKAEAPILEKDGDHVVLPDHVQGYVQAHRTLKYKLGTPIVIENKDSKAAIDFTILVEKLLNGKKEIKLADLEGFGGVAITTGKLTPDMANNTAHSIIIKN